MQYKMTTLSSGMVTYGRVYEVLRAIKTCRSVYDTLRDQGMTDAHALCDEPLYFNRIFKRAMLAIRDGSKPNEPYQVIDEQTGQYNGSATTDDENRMTYMMHAIATSFYRASSIMEFDSDECINLKYQLGNIEKLANKYPHLALTKGGALNDIRYADERMQHGSSLRGFSIFYAVNSQDSISLADAVIPFGHMIAYVNSILNAPADANVDAAKIAIANTAMSALVVAFHVLYRATYGIRKAPAVFELGADGIYRAVSADVEKEYVSRITLGSPFQPATKITFDPTEMTTSEKATDATPLAAGHVTMFDLLDPYYKHVCRLAGQRYANYLEQATARVNIGGTDLGQLPEPIKTLMSNFTGGKPLNNETLSGLIQNVSNILPGIGGASAAAAA